MTTSLIRELRIIVADYGLDGDKKIDSMVCSLAAKMESRKKHKTSPRKEAILQFPREAREWLNAQVSKSSYPPDISVMSERYGDEIVRHLYLMTKKHPDRQIRSRGTWGCLLMFNIFEQSDEYKHYVQNPTTIEVLPWYVLPTLKSKLDCGCNSTGGEVWLNLKRCISKIIAPLTADAVKDAIIWLSLEKMFRVHCYKAGMKILREAIILKTARPARRSQSEASAPPLPAPSAPPLSELKPSAPSLPEPSSEQPPSYDTLMLCENV